MNRVACLMIVFAAVGCSPQPDGDDTTPPRVAEATGEQADDGVAGITPDRAKAANIEVLAAGPARIRETLTLYGVVKTNAELAQTVRARYPGTVRSVSKRPGDAVERGETLLTIESNETLEQYAIHAPMAGTVLDRQVNPGELVDSSTVLMTMADLSTMWAEFQVFARDLGEVRAGMPVRIHAGDSPIAGQSSLAYVAQAGHADSQSVIARAVLDNADRRWVGGQFLTGDVVVSDTSADVTVVPAALQTMNSRSAVFVQSDAGFELRTVEVGKRNREAVQVLSGVSAGDRYAAKNSYLIKAELLKSEVEEE